MQPRRRQVSSRRGKKRDKKTILNLTDVKELTPQILKDALRLAGVSGYGEHGWRQVPDLYFKNEDHGFKHSQAVFKRCLAIMDQSPMLGGLYPDEDDNIIKIMVLASILHDLGRFLGAKFMSHQRVGADLAKDIAVGTAFNRALYLAILEHDYISPLVDYRSFPHSLLQPLSEIFRLADKTSLSPSEEIRRYYQTGKTFWPAMPFFNPDMPDEVRFNFSFDETNSDMLCWFLRLFALQATDFIFGDTRDAYAYWARGKIAALDTIGELCLEEEYLDGRVPADPREVKDVVWRFVNKYHLILGV